MKKNLSLMLAIILAASALSGCGSTSYQAATKDPGTKIVATIFPEYDWLMKVLGDNPANMDVTLLLDSGVDLHSYQPSTEDILKISTADLLIYVGGESDAWIDDALEEAMNKDMVVVNLLDILGDAAWEEELAEGMQGDCEEEEEPEYDEHVWLSLKNTSLFVEQISEKLKSLDPANADLYSANAKAYQAELNALDEDYREAVSDAEITTLLFADRFPFRYMVEDYGLSYYAAFAGCSAETEASFETVSFLSRKLDELKLPAVITLETGDQRMAQTIIQNTADKNQKILTLDSMQSTKDTDIAAGADYLSIMRKNLEVLKEALHAA